MQLLVEKLQHLKRINIYFQHAPGSPPDIRLTNKEVILVNKDVNDLIQSLAHIVSDAECEDLRVRMINTVEEDSVVSSYEFPLFEFDCDVDAEEAVISGFGEDYMVIMVPIDEGMSRIQAPRSCTDTPP
jgi:hypothetical protein